MKKPDDVSIVSITNNLNTVYGLGSDQKMYQWNTLDASWRLYALKKDIEIAPTVQK